MAQRLTWPAADPTSSSAGRQTLTWHPMSATRSTWPAQPSRPTEQRRQRA